MAEEATGEVTVSEETAETVTTPEPTEAPDWRELITSDEGRKYAENSPDLNHLVQRALDTRRQLSTAVRVPGKDASDEDIATYRRAMNIPLEASGYEFPEVENVTDEIKVSREMWAQRFHDLGISKSAAKALSQFVNEDNAAYEAKQTELDRQFASDQEGALKGEWKGDFDKNKTLANRAFNEIANRAGLDIDMLTKMETKDGRFLMDNASMVRMFAAIGREMAEGTLGPVLTESETETLQGEVDSLREQIADAQAKGDSKKANRLYKKEQELLGRIHGDRPIVGSEGRAA